MKKQRKMKNKVIWLTLIIIVILSYFLISSFFTNTQYTITGGKDYLGNDFSSLNKIFQSFSLVDSTCTPDTGYNICIDGDSESGKAKASVEIQSTGLQEYNTYKDGYYVGNVYLPIKSKSDYLYLYDGKGISNYQELYNEADCDYEGCYNYEKTITNNEILLATSKQSYSGCPLFVAYDYDYEERTSSDTKWWWDTYIGLGYGYFDTRNTGNCLNIKSVECYDDSDCGNNFYCDKENNNWNEWSCKGRQCNLEDESCDIFNYLTCSNFEWQDNGIVRNKCNVECIADKDCKAEETTSEPYCKNNNIVQDKTSNFCDTRFYNCEINQEIEIIENCTNTCENAKCIENTPENDTIEIPSYGGGGGAIDIEPEQEDTSYIYYIALIGIFGFIGGLIILSSKK